MTKQVSYQDIITSSIGDMGKSQVIIILAIRLPTITAAMSMLIVSFATGNVDWWRVTMHYNASSGNSTIVKAFKSCPIGVNDTVEYSSGVYSIVNEWRLFCDHDHIPIWIQTCQMCGVFAGTLVIGQLGDWIGRKKCLLFVYTLNLTSVFIIVFSGNWMMMITCIFFVGFSLGGYFVLPRIYSTEFIGTKWRTVINFMPVWSIGVLIIGFGYMSLHHWKYLYALNAAMCVPLLVLMWFIPESIRWLLSQGKIKEAQEILKRLAKRNGLPEPNAESLEIVLKGEMVKQKNTSLKYNYFTIFKYKFTRWRVPIFAFICFTSSYSYYALTFEVSLLEGNAGVNMILFAVCEIFSQVGAWLISKKLGRKYTTLVLYALTALSSFGITIAYVAEVNDVEKVRTALSIVSRFFLGGAWVSVELYTLEMFPTKLRSTTFGFVSVISRVGGIVAPQGAVFYDISRYIPYTINGFLAAVSSFLVIFLHDTYSQDLQDDFEEESKSKLKEDYENTTFD